MKDNRQNLRERAIVLKLIWGEELKNSKNQTTEEIERLIETAGGEVVAKVIQKRESPDPRTFLGKGKIDEIKRIVSETDADLVVIDSSITPSQQRQLEDELKVKILDRTAIILDIFARHASTLEGKLQVELAQLNYLLPRLYGRGTELSRLGGGIGTRGPGETKLEVDRRRIKARIATLKRKLKRLENHRNLIRRQRIKKMFTVALVGYTNAGKSTLLNTLTKASVRADNQLFATLDPTTRRLYLDNDVSEVGEPVEIVISDTVGFIRNLPHELIAAFYSTLEEVRLSDLLLHVIDASHPDYQLQMVAVEETLKTIGADNVPMLTVFNKIDQLSEMEKQRMRNFYPDALFISAITGEGIEELRKNLHRLAAEGKRVKTAR